MSTPTWQAEHKRDVLREAEERKKVSGLSWWRQILQAPAPTTHDYSVRHWGHDYTFSPRESGFKAHMMGWGFGIERGDYLILLNKATGSTTRYRVDKISYFHDPPDMWSADVSFAPQERHQEKP